MRGGWSLDDLIWRRMRNEFEERAWRKHPLDMTYLDSIPQSPGVYAICATASNDKRCRLRDIVCPIYAGHATVLRRRFVDHCKGYGDVRRAQKCFPRLWYWYTEMPKADLRSAEQLLIDCFGPPANRINSIGARVGAPVPAGSL